MHKRILTKAGLFLLFLPIVVSGQSAPFGYEIGQSIQEKENLMSREGRGLISDYWYIEKEVKFFDEVEIEVSSEDVIEVISANKTYDVTLQNIKVQKRSIKNDFFDIVDRLEQKYGDADKENASEIYGMWADSNMFYLYQEISQNVIIRDVNDDNIDRIFISLISEGSDEAEVMQGAEIMLAITYMSKNAVQEVYERSESRFDDL